ncbi:MAG: gliding motility-associated C-terminal domain-containing protein [Vicingaceae bacterium]
MRNYYFIILFLLSFFQAQANCADGTIAAPVVDSVSLDVNGNLHIAWQEVLDPDLSQYLIWTIDPTGANVQLGSVMPGTTYFTVPTGNVNNFASTQSMPILIQAEMNCAGAPQVLNPPFPIPPSEIGLINTIFLEEQFVKCSSSINLNWNAYDDFSNPSVRYEVYVSIDGGAYVLETNTFSTSYSFTGVQPNFTYDFYVVAVENGGVGPFRSYSNIVNSDVSTALIPRTYNYLNNVSVVDSQQIDIYFSVDTAADATDYKIQRATSLSGTYTTVSSVSKFQGMDTIVYFSDEELNTDSTSYFYRIEIVNTECGFSGDYSNISNTVLIDVVSSPLDAINTITISEYKDWSLGVSRYDIYRAVGGVWETAPIKSLPAFSDSTVYVDNIAGVQGGDGEFCYRVDAIENGIASYTSSSNESCAFHNPLLYVPNAFSPRGLNNTEFKPVLTFANPGAYSFRVFDRWGQVVFETGNIGEGWNGSYNNSGKLAATGVYFYVIEFESAEGEEFLKRGTVTIVN